MHGQHQALLLLGDCKRSEHPFLSTVDDHAVHLDAAQIGGSRTTRLVSSDESDGWSRGRIHGRLAFLACLCRSARRNMVRLGRWAAGAQRAERRPAAGGGVLQVGPADQ